MERNFDPDANDVYSGYICDFIALIKQKDEQ